MKSLTETIKRNNPSNWIILQNFECNLWSNLYQNYGLTFDILYDRIIINNEIMQFYDMIKITETI